MPIIISNVILIRLVIWSSRFGAQAVGHASLGAAHVNPLTCRRHLEALLDALVSGYRAVPAANTPGTEIRTCQLA